MKKTQVVRSKGVFHAITKNGLPVSSRQIELADGRILIQTGLTEWVGENGDPIVGSIQNEIFTEWVDAPQTSTIRENNFYQD